MKKMIMELAGHKSDPFPPKPNMPPSVIPKHTPQNLPRVPENPSNRVPKLIKQILLELVSINTGGPGHYRVMP